MRKGYLLLGYVLFVIGIALGSYALEREFPIIFLVRGYMAGFIGLAGLVIVLVGFIRGRKRVRK